MVDTGSARRLRGRRNTDRGEAFQLAGVSAARPAGEQSDTYPAVRNGFDRPGMTVSMFFFNLDSYLQLTGGNKSLVRARQSQRALVIRRERGEEWSNTGDIRRPIRRSVQLVGSTQTALCSRTPGCVITSLIITSTGHFH